MLELLYTGDKEILEPLFRRLGIAEKAGVNIVLTNDKQPIGACLLDFDGEKVVFKTFKIQEGFDSFGNVDFFFRAVLFKLSFAPVIIEIPSTDNRLENLGFIDVGGKMQVVSTEVTFNSNCENHHK